MTDDQQAAAGPAAAGGRAAAAARPAAARALGVEEEFLLVSAGGGHLVAAGERVADRAQDLAGDPDAAEHELKQEQAEIGSKPCYSLDELRAQLSARRHALGDAAAAADARVLALGTYPLTDQPSTTAQPRYRRLMDRFGAVSGDEQLTCGQHVHVDVDSDEEAVAVVDRLQRWLPTLRAMTTNSPFWRGGDTGYASYRSVLWERWPTAGASQPFGSPAAYRDTVERLIRSGAALDEGAIYFDARVSATYPTVEIRVADVSIDIERAVVIGALCRALVEQCAQSWRDGVPAARIRPEFLRAAGWLAARSGLSDQLLALPDVTPVVAAEAVARLVAFARPALERYGDSGAVDAEVQRLCTVGTGADEQRALVAAGADLQALTAWGCDRTLA